MLARTLPVLRGTAWVPRRVTAASVQATRAALPAAQLAVRHISAASPAARVRLGDAPTLPLASTVPRGLEPVEWAKSSRRTGLLAIKCGMMSLWSATGDPMPVTVLQVDQCQVVQVKTEAKEGFTALQVGCSIPKIKGLTKPVVFHCLRHGVAPKKKLTEFRVTPDAILPEGTELTVRHFLPGQFVDVCSTRKGKGFQGAMKRWGFGGLNASHGVSVSHRSIGSTGGRQDPGRVFKGKKMPGHVGPHRVTVFSLQIIKLDPSRNLLYVKGAVPGHAGTILRVTDAQRKPLPDVPPFPTFVPSPDETTLPGEMWAPLEAAEDWVLEGFREFEGI